MRAARARRWVLLTGFGQTPRDFFTHLLGEAVHQRRRLKKTGFFNHGHDAVRRSHSLESAVRVYTDFDGKVASCDVTDFVLLKLAPPE